METQLTTEEKTIIVNALYAYWAEHTRAGRLLPGTNKMEFKSKMDAINQLWLKCLLDVEKIQIVEPNNMFRTSCVLCGASFRPHTPYWAAIGGATVCCTCFEKHEPELYKDVTSRNDEYWAREYPDEVKSMEQAQSTNKSNNYPF